MARNIIILGILIALCSPGCKAPAYLPDAEEIGIHEFGSFVIIDLTEGSDIEGELIAVDDTALIVLSKEDENRIQSVPIARIKGFKLMYAQPKNYGWTIPVSALATLSHGFLLVFTAPVNIIVTSGVTARGANAFTYNDGDITMEEIKMFARFPQGLPPDIEVANLK
ncbi:hypothetical protein [Salinimicrobium xinjiangense]|uniref:hypothetical protein n=1 Tax=Salinimicrobium xinjiangense TaxID=438596 RepID=UPI00040DF205|nr:hypothetical protein [Salinimicrobium xinjiangense]